MWPFTASRERSRTTRHKRRVKRRRRVVKRRTARTTRTGYKPKGVWAILVWNVFVTGPKRRERRRAARLVQYRARMKVAEVRNRTILVKEQRKLLEVKNKEAEQKRAAKARATAKTSRGSAGAGTGTMSDKQRRAMFAANGKKRLPRLRLPRF